MTDFHYANGAQFIAKDDMIVRWLRQGHGPFEPVTTQWLFDRLDEREGLYLDVGASTGWFAVPVGMRGREVVAVECNARVLKRLRENLDLNEVEAEVHAVAATDREGEVTFTYNPSWPLTSGGSLEPMVRGNRASETVRAATLDSLIGDRKVAVLKMDVEGHEIAALDGARRLIARDRPFMVLEANTTAHEGVLAVFLWEVGYTYVKADERNLLCSPRS